nr:PREDICTED: uncharacterized protein LOC107078005 [Lepisosteus oculatus]
MHEISSEGHQDFERTAEKKQDSQSDYQEGEDVCSACGNVFSSEEAPYLEVVCAADSTQGQFGLEGIGVEGEEITSQAEANFEKQGSLIAVAWSKQTEQSIDDTPLPEESENIEADFPNELERELITIPSEKQPEEISHDAASDSVFVNDTLQAEKEQDQPIEKAPSAAQTEAKCFQHAMTVVHISEMEREETMRSLVDMQRKAESKYQRDKERQMLRVQERLSIIQNRKSDEDLLGNKQGKGLMHLMENFKKAIMFILLGWKCTVPCKSIHQLQMLSHFVE